MLLVLSVVFFLILDKSIFYFLKKLQELIIRRPSLKSFDVLHELARPIALIIIIEIIEAILPSLQLFGINDFLFLSLEIAKTVFWVFVFLKLMKVVLSMYNQYTEKTITKLDEQLAPILKKVLDGIIILIGILNILTLFGVDPITVLTGASIGGIAIAFAAQDSVKNLIGTIVIFLDNPFHIGDWIEMGEAVGTVERVGLRSTQIRGLDTSVYQVPNSIISESVINNKGLRIYRRYTTELGIRYDTPPVLIEAFVKGVRELIVAHPDTRSESYNVEFTGFGDSALLILLNVYFKQLDWGVEQSSKHRLHIGIVKLAAALNVQFAFPSSTLMIEQFPEKKEIDMHYITDNEVINRDIKAVLDDFEKENK
jgi:MscS family membrane protein